MTSRSRWLILPLVATAGCGDNGASREDFAAQMHAPVAVVQSLVVVAEGALATLDGSRSYDADNDIARYDWTQTRGAPAVTLSGTDRSAATFTAPDVNGSASLEFKLTVTDAQGQSGSAVVSVTLLDLNPAPGVDAGPDQSVEAGTLVTLTGAVTDNGGIASLEWRQIAGLPSVTLANATTTAADFSAPDVEQPRVLAFELIATDNEGKAAGDQVAVRIEPVAVGVAFVASSVPATVLRNSPWAPIEVEVLNATGQRITSGAAARLAITVSVQPMSGSADGVLSGALSGTARFGMLRFTDLSYDEVTPSGSPLRLDAAGLGLAPLGSSNIAVTWPSALPGGIVATNAITVRAMTLVNDDLVVAGSFDGVNVDFAPSAAVVERTSAGIDGFVARYNVTTGALAWVQVIGGPGVVEITGVAPTAGGGLVVTATYVASAEFPVDGGPARIATAHGGTDAAVAGLSGSGSTQWLADFGGLGDDTPAGLAIDSAGNAIVAGSFQRSVDFDPGAGTATSASVSDSLDAFVLKLTSSGAYVWHTVWGAAQDDWAATVVVPTSGNAAYFGGATGALALVGQVDSAGAVTWSHTLGSVLGTAVTAIAADGSGTLYAAGEFRGSGDFDPGAGTRTLTANGNTDAFALSMGATTGALLWALSYGGPDDETVGTVALRPGAPASALVAGSFANVVDFNAGTGVYEVMSAGPRSGYLLALTPASGAFEWAGIVGSDTAAVGATTLFPTATRIFMAGDIDRGSVTDIDPGATRVRFVVPAGAGIYLTKVTGGGSVVP